MFVDLVILGVLLVSAVFAFLRGFIREVLTILGVVGGLAASLSFGKQLVPLMSHWIGVDKDAEKPQMLMDIVPLTVVADVLAYGSIFLVVVIVLSLVSGLLAGWARTIGLGAIDRTLGVVFGIARGVLVLAVLYLLPYLLFKEEDRKSWVQDSRMIVYIEKTSAWLAEFLPDSIRKPADGPGEKASDLAKATRDKLKDLELLKDGEEKKPDAAPAEEGYGTDLRQDMQELIHDQAADSMPPMPAGTSPATAPATTTDQPAMKMNE